MAGLGQAMVGAPYHVEPPRVARAAMEEPAVCGRDHLVAVCLDHQQAGDAGGRLGTLSAPDLGYQRGPSLLWVRAGQVEQGRRRVPGDDG